MFCSSYHLHFHINTLIKGWTHNKVRGPFLDRMQPPSRSLLCRFCSASAASCFCVLIPKPLGHGQWTYNGNRVFEWGPNQWNHLQNLGQPAVECWQPFRAWPRHLRPCVCRCLMVCFHGIILIHRTGNSGIRVLLCALAFCFLWPCHTVVNWLGLLQRWCFQNKITTQHLVMY